MTVPSWQHSTNPTSSGNYTQEISLASRERQDSVFTCWKRPVPKTTSLCMEPQHRTANPGTLPLLFTTPASTLALLGRAVCKQKPTDATQRRRIPRLFCLQPERAAHAEPYTRYGLSGRGAATFVTRPPAGTAAAGRPLGPRDRRGTRAQHTLDLRLQLH